MIIFVIIIAVVVAILATIFSTRFFGIVSNVLRGLGYGAGIAWNTFRQTVTWENILAALTPVMGLFIFFGIGSLVFHALFFLFAWGIGIYFNAPWAGFFIGILFPIWAILRSIRFGALRIIYGIMSVVLILAVAHLTIGIISPEYKESLDRWTQNKKLEMANSLNKSSLQSEQESGLFAKVKENVTLLNKDNMPTRVIQKGELVRVLNLSGKKADEKSEGMIEVMYQDEFGYYSGKRIGRLPSRILDWDWKETKTADIRNNAPAPAYNQAPAPSPAPAP
ncbi:MAG TPA: hypothetical protein DIT25_02415, partial [Candidatus Moranbacteria bacterium]|nr:hypothetical protein [Candidatus Moranbacteria bacterium]